jgi:acyl-CoA dehydrogenase
LQLLNQDIRSCFAMTEPGVASSDATQISSTIVRDGDEYVLNGHKWYISGACRKTCRLAIFLGKTPNPEFKRHQQQSMIICPMWQADGTMTPGVTLVRAMAVFGHDGDHAELVFDDVRVPASNMILGEGRGFEIAQGRLGPGRIHHCMRSIGSAEMALSAMIFRIQNRVAFGGSLEKKDSIRQTIAEARIEITKCRGLCYLAAVIADERGFKDAKKYIAMIKVAAPRMALKIVDDAIQVHGAHGVSQDCKLPDMYTHLRTLRVADGPDIVHMNPIVKEELKAPLNPLAAQVSGINPHIKKYNKAILPNGYFDDYYAGETQEEAKL